MSANRLVRAPPQRSSARFVGRTAYLEPGDSINAAIAQLAPTMASPATVRLAPGAYTETVGTALEPFLLGAAVILPPGISVVGCGPAQTSLGTIALTLSNTIAKTLAGMLAGEFAEPVEGGSVTLSGLTLEGGLDGRNPFVAMSLENIGAVVSLAGTAVELRCPVSLKGTLACTIIDRDESIKMTGDMQALGSTIIVRHLGGRTGAIGLELSSTGGSRVGSIQLYDCTLLMGSLNGALSVEQLSVVDSQLATSAPPVTITLAEEYALVYIGHICCERAGPLAAPMIFSPEGVSPPGLRLSLGEVKWVARGAANANLYDSITNIVTEPNGTTTFSACLVLP